MLDQEFKSLLLENLPAPVMIYDLEGNCVYANTEACLTRGYSEEEFSSLSIDSLCAPGHAENAFRALRLLADRSEITFECVQKKKDGTRLNVNVHARALNLGGRDLVLSLATSSDGNDKASPQVKISDLLVQEMLDATPYCIMLVDSNKIIKYVNDATLELLGYESRDDLVGTVCNEAICPAEKDECPVWDLKQDLDKAERKAVTRDGALVPILKSATRISSNGDELLLEAFVDISRIKEAEEFISGILESVDEGFIVIDRDYKIISANRAFVNQSKIPLKGIVNNHCYRVSHHSEVPCYESGEDCAVRHTFDTGEPHTTLHTHLTSEGDPIYVETKSYPLRDPEGNITSAIEVINDITESRKLEAQLRQSQKMEAVGTLAGGIAHDFNNILTTILGYSEFIRDEANENIQLKKYIDMVISSATRAARLTQSLLAFSRRQIIHPEPVNINTTIEKMQSMISRLIGEDIEVKASTAEEPLVVMADGMQIEQIIMNLATNARDAMPEGGTLFLKAEGFEMDKHYTETHGYGEPGQYALLTVSDNGTGMDDKTIAQMFEPFFTTKPVGQGTGLGLAVAYGIIKQHEGFVNVYSELGVGTSFKIFLPLIQGGIWEMSEDKPVTTKSGTETILIAEDDDAVRGLVSKTLTDYGYRVIEMENGESAIQWLKENIDGVDMLLLDIIMPKKGGFDVYREGRQLKPGIKAMLMSGYPADVIDKKQMPDEDIKLVMKPVSPSDLIEKVREVLDS